MGLVGKKGCCGQQRKGKGIMNNKKNLKMKPVGSEYMEQYNALLRYVFQVTEQVNVVYKRKGNTYGLIEPEF